MHPFSYQPFQQFFVAHPSSDGQYKPLELSALKPVSPHPKTHPPSLASLEGSHTVAFDGSLLSKTENTPNLSLSKKSIGELAEQFASASWRKLGADLRQIHPVLAEVHRRDQKEAFDHAVYQLAHKEGRSFESAFEVVEDELAKGMINKVLNKAALKETLDYLEDGENHYRPSSMEYRLRGIYTALEDFMAICMRYPLVSLGVIGGVALLGKKYPFIGAASGAAIMGWSGVSIAKHELKASKMPPQMTDEKARHYQESGENLAAFLMTASAADDIVINTNRGIKVFTAPSTKQVTNRVVNLLSRSWNTIKFSPQHEAQPGIRFILGLLDNVLLPFNQMADKLLKRPQQ